MAERIRLWWQLAVALAAGLTRPIADVEESDRTVKVVVRDSRLFGAVYAAGASGCRAWSDARSRAAWIRIVAGWAALSGAERVRAAGVAVAVAGITAVLAVMTSPVPAGPLVWVLPAAIAGLGLFASIAAAPLARAIADKTS